MVTSLIQRDEELATAAKRIIDQWREEDYSSFHDGWGFDGGRANAAMSRNKTRRGRSLGAEDNK